MADKSEPFAVHMLLGLKASDVLRDGLLPQVLTINNTKLRHIVVINLTRN